MEKLKIIRENAEQFKKHIQDMENLENKKREQNQNNSNKEPNQGNKTQSETENYLIATLEGKNEIIFYDKNKLKKIYSIGDISNDENTKIQI